MEDCIFCKIGSKEMEADIVAETDNIIVFRDIKPRALTHLLFVPKKHIISVKHLEPADVSLMGELLMTAQKVAQERNLEGYTLQINVGREGGQVVDHIHLHLLSNKES